MYCWRRPCWRELINIPGCDLGCYKPIIGKFDTKETSIWPITFANLKAHPEVRRVCICASTASADLPDFEIENRAGECYLLRGVVLPWGPAAFHAERIDESLYTIPSYATGQGPRRAVECSPLPRRAIITLIKSRRWVTMNHKLMNEKRGRSSTLITGIKREVTRVTFRSVIFLHD